jgi:hypothetical protein
VPAFNCARFLGEALDSIFAQTYRPIERIMAVPALLATPDSGVPRAR